MNGLTKIDAVLTAVFAFSLVALLAQLIYVLWRRRRFRLASLSGGGSQVSGSDPFNTPPSKELLYFFCWKSQSRVEPAGAPSPYPPHLPELEDEEAKLQLGILYGPSRVLFTIKEEEREGAETENCSSSAETDHRVKRVCLDECFTGGVSLERDTGLVPEDGVAVAVAVTIDNFNDEGATPFSTPCSSPPFYTPSPSPSRDGTTLNYSQENDVSSSESTGGSESGFACLEDES